MKAIKEEVTDAKMRRTHENANICKLQGERIKYLLTLSGKNAIDLHRYVGYSGDSMIYLIMKGERFMSRSKMAKAAKFLGVHEAILMATTPISSEDLNMYHDLMSITDLDKRRALAQVIKSFTL